MLYEIKNGNISVSADTFGAELHSIKCGDIEYLWQCGDAWKRLWKKSHAIKLDAGEQYKYAYKIRIR